MKEVHVFDIDGTVTTSNCLLQDISSYVGSKVNLEDLVEYDIAETLHIMRFIDDESLFDSVDFFKNHADRYLMESEPHEGVLEYIKRLKDEGHEVWFLTARHGDNEPKTRVLFDNMGLEYTNVIHTGGAAYKYKYLESIKATHFYEDRPDTVEFVHKEMPHIKVYCVRYPYNRYTEDMREVVPIYDWNELLDPR